MGGEGRVWTGVSEDDVEAEPEPGPVLDLGLKIEEPASLRDAPKPLLPIPEPEPARPKPVAGPPEPPKAPVEARPTAPVSSESIAEAEAEAEPLNEEPGGGEEEPASPLGIRVEEPASLRDGPKMPVPLPVEVMPSEKSKKAEPEGPETGDRATRRAYLGREASATAIGLLLYFQAILLLLYTGYWTGRMLDSLKDLEPGPELTTLRLSILHEGSVLLSSTGALFLMGAGLRFLRPWGRWISVTLMAQTVLVSLIALLTLVLKGSAQGVPIAYLLLVAGITVPLWTLYVLLSEPSEVVFSAGYRELIVRTRGVRRPVSWMVVLLFLLEVAAWGIWGGACTGVEAR